MKIILDNNSGKHRAISANRVAALDGDISPLLAKWGLSESDVTTFTQEQWEQRADRQARKAEKDAQKGAAESKRRAVAKVRERMPELANDAALSVLYVVWDAVDHTKLPAAVGRALGEWADEKGYPLKNGMVNS